MKSETFEPGSNKVLQIEGRITSILKKFAKVELFRGWASWWMELGGFFQFALVLGLGLASLGIFWFPLIDWIMK